MVLAVPDGQPDALRSAAEIQGVVAVGGDWKPVIPFHFLAQRGEMRKQVFALQRVDLRNGLPFAADHRIVLLRYPQHAVEQSLPIQDLSRTDLDDETIYPIHGFFAPKVGFIEERLVCGQQKWLDLAQVAKIFIGQLEMS